MASGSSSPGLVHVASMHDSPIGSYGSSRSEYEASSSPGPSPRTALSANGSPKTHLHPSSGKSRASISVFDVDPAPAASALSHASFSLSLKPAAKSPLRSLLSLGSALRGKSPPSTAQTDGRLPLRAYEPATTSPSAAAFATRQTILERTPSTTPLSATSRTPPTGRAVAYSPYQPSTPCIPVASTLLTKEERLRIKRLTPRAPTVEMVQSSKEMW